MRLLPRLSFFSTCLLLFLAGLGLPRESLGATNLLANNYAIRVWQTEEGLPQNTVTAITQTRDGYIWIGTYGGLARFDGNRFQVFDAVTTPALEDSRIVSLHEDSNGVLWMGHDSGAVTRYQRGRFTSVPTRARQNGDRVSALGTDANGTTWLLRQSGSLESVPDGKLVPVTESLSPGVLSLSQISNDRFWVLREGRIAQFAQGKLEQIDLGPAQYTGYAMGMCAASDGGLWVVHDKRTRKWSRGQWTEDRGPCPWGDTSVTTMIEMHDGTLAVGTMDQGCYLIFPDGSSTHFDRNNGLPQDWVRFLFEDREGNLWVGAGTGGLAALRATPFTVVNAPDQWRGRTVLSVAPGRDGALWIGTEGAGLYRYRAGEWAHFDDNEGLGNLFVWSIAEGAAGEIWTGTWGAGVFKLQDNRFTRPPLLDTTANLAVLALYLTPERNTLWMGTGHGLLRWNEKETSEIFQVGPSGASNVCTIAQDDQGVLWFGLSGGGLGRMSEGKITQFRRRDGLSSDSVQSLLPDGDVLWIGTADGGLNRLKNGRFAAIGAAQGLASNVICHIADDGRGNLWLSTHHGILRIAKSELNRCADGLVRTVFPRVYDRSDGLPTIEYSGGMQAAGCTTTDGRLWFTSSKGLITVDPTRIQTSPTPPALAIESIRVDSRVIGVLEATSPPLQLGPDHQHLEFDYTALSFIDPSKVLFKYRLDGLDHDWVEAGTKRTASYSHLPAGSYRFHVVACNNDGVWNMEGATFAFTVLPYSWQTWWFRSLAALIVLTVVASAVRYETRRRMQRKMERLEREHAIERERARIAQDIHDDIGASLTRITMLSQSVRSELNQPEHAASVLDGIYGTAREVTRALDEIVWAVDPRHDTLDSMVGYMGKFAQDFLGAANIRCRLDLPVQLPTWPVTAEIRHNLFLAFKESLNNAVKHAGATEVRISLTLRSDAFVLRVKDNGHGFDPNQPATHGVDRVAAGHGLANLHRRLALIGGLCEIESKPQQGSSISFIVPLPAPPP